MVNEKGIRENLEGKVNKWRVKDIIVNISALPGWVIYVTTEAINKPIQLTKKRYFKKHGILYEWKCAQRHKGDVFLDHLFYCVRKD